MAVDLYANSATPGTVLATTLSGNGGSITSGATSMLVASSTGFPAASNSAVPATQFRVLVDSELLIVTNVSGTTWTVTRGAEGSTAASHTDGAAVTHVLTAATQTGWQTTRSAQINVKDVFGVKGDGKTVTDGAMTSGSATLTSATAGFTAADVGKSVLVSNATSTAMRLACTIAAVGSGTSITLSTPARVSASSVSITIDGFRTVADAVTTNDSTTLTSATAAFTSADVGKMIQVQTVGRVALNTTISGFTNSTTVTLAASATRTCTASQVVYGTDDTATIINAFAYAGTTPCQLYFPRSMYLAKPSHLGTSAMNIPSNTRVFGDGPTTIIRSTGAEDAATLSRELWGINSGSGGTTDPAANVKNVLIENIQFQGTCTEEGFQEDGSNLLSLNACSSVTVRDCVFYNMRSDGIYIGSGTAAGVERHNEDVLVENCVFDGVNCDTRNGISVIDCTDLEIHGCTFKNLGRETMPGAIDCEPNDQIYYRLRGIRIHHNYFTQIGGNQAVASFFQNTPQQNMTVPLQGWQFTNNIVRNVLSSTTGVMCFTPTFPDDSCARHNVLVADNYFLGDKVTNTGMGNPMDLEGVRGARVTGNTWDWSEYSLLIGANYKCLDVDIAGNTFKDVGYTGGKAIEIARGDRINIEGNTFDHISPLGGGYITRFINGSNLATPPIPTCTPSASGGTLAAGTKGYRISAIMDNGTETLAGTEGTCTTSGSTGSVVVSWTPVYGAKGYNVYGRTSGAELKMTPAALAQTVLTFTDTNAVTPSGALPGSNTTGNGGTDGVYFRRNIIRQGASNSISNISNLVAGHVTVANDLRYEQNIVPNNAALPIAPFVAATIVYASVASLTIDASLVPDNGTVQINLGSTANTSTTIANGVTGQVIVFEWIQDGTGSRTWTNPANLKLSSTAWTHNTVASKRDCITARFDGTNWNEHARALIVG